MKKIILLFCLFAGFTNFLTAQTIDPNFNVTLGESNSIKQVIPQSDGKILICGQITSVNGVQRIGIARLNEDGSLDNSFQPNLPAGIRVDRMLLKMDGNILVASNGNKVNQLGSDGIVQTSFSFGNVPGYGEASAGAKDFIQLADGKILVLGSLYVPSLTQRNCIYRVNNDGSADLSFRFPGSANTDMRSMVVLPSGKIMIGIGLLRLESNGAIDNTFNVGFHGPNGTVEAITLYNNLMVIAGSFNSYNNQPIKHVAFIEEDGSLNTNFQTGSGFDSGIIHTTKRYGGILLVGGQFDSFNGVARPSFAGLNLNGTLNPAINSNNIISRGGAVYDFGIQNDGKIIVAGSITYYSSGGKARKTGIVRFLAPNLNTLENKNIYLNLYPNPAKDILNFSEELSNIRISDLSGKLIKQISNSEKSINVSHLAKETYIISATTKTGETINKKFIKE